MLFRSRRERDRERMELHIARDSGDQRTRDQQWCTDDQREWHHRTEQRHGYAVVVFQRSSRCERDVFLANHWLMMMHYAPFAKSERTDPVLSESVRLA